eukprot:447844_1
MSTEKQNINVPLGQYICNATITKEQLYNNHQQQLQNQSYNNTCRTAEIVNIFGGIDNVLSVLLSSSGAELSNNQLIQINDILMDDSINVPDINEEINRKEIQNKDWAYNFSTHNTFLHSKFGEATGQKIFDIIHSNYTIMVICILILI